MLINVNMLPAMNLTKPNMQRQYEQGPRSYRSGQKKNNRGRGGGLIPSRKNIFFIFSHDIHPRATPGEGRTRNRCGPSGKTDQGNRAARVVNDGGGLDQEQEGPREPYLLPADQDQTGPRLHEYYSKAILNQIA